jgi:CHAT domain-containing protein
MGISRAFIAKGVPLVVASLWDVDASATAELMIKFHGYRKLERLPSSAALRQAQLTLLRDLHSVYRSPYYWASFESIGGHSGF